MGDCTVCFEQPAQAVLPCGHAFCAMCIREAVRAAVSISAFPVPCLACAHPLPRSVISVALQDDPDLGVLFLQSELQASLMRDPLVRFCPAPGCGNAFVCNADQGSCPRITCPACQGRMCYLCRAAWHPGSCALAECDTLKPCPHCGVAIYKGPTDGCNAMQCTVCQYRFCWLCLSKIDPIDGVMHFSSLTGCTLFGRRRWSPQRLLAIQLTAPLTAPLAVGGAAVFGALLIVVSPALLASEEWRNRRNASRGARVAHTAAMALMGAIITPPLVGVGVTTVAAQLAYAAYVKMPYLQAKHLYRRLRARAHDD
eukprot:m.140027 g.140027  ORF g.140027 m.140027 type:complete len:312 (+) comp9625_c0_seq3:173-1108(+)